MTDGRPSVVVSHPGTQQVYETVAGLQSAGMLHRFLASAYARDGQPEQHAPWRWLPPAQRARAAAGLRKRSHPAIDPMLVHEMPWPFLVMRGVSSGLSAAGLRRYAGIERLGDAWFDRNAAAWVAHEPGITQVHAFEGEALHTFAAARERGLRTILDAPAAHEYNIALCDEEARATGQARPRRFGSPDRIAGERALADVVVSPSRFVTRCLREHGVGVSKIVEIPFGADIDVFTPPARPPGDRRFRLLCVASINARKGTRYLLDAWARLSLPEAELVLVGTPDAFGERLLAERGGACTHIPHVPWFELPDLFRSATAFVLPSLAEGSALVTYMAMATGLPVVVTEDAGAVARHGIDGYVVPSRDPAALADAIARLYEDRTAAAAMGASGRALISEQYTWRHYHERVVALHQEIYDRDDARPPGGNWVVTPAREGTRIAWGMQL